MNNAYNGIEVLLNINNNKNKTFVNISNDKEFIYWDKYKNGIKIKEVSDIHEDIIKDVIIDVIFLRSQWREPESYTKYHFCIFIDDCLIKTHDDFIKSNEVDDKVNLWYKQISGDFNKDYEQESLIDILDSVMPYNWLKNNLKHTVKITCQPMFDDNLNIIRKEM